MEQLLNPGVLWWLAALFPAIIVLYFLKLRRQPRVVSSTLLWKRSVYDLRVNAPFQRLRRNLLLLLQLLVALLVILALARPFAKLTHAQGRQAALILDCSASMGTRDEAGGRTRLEAAKEEALRLVDGLGVSGLGARQEDELCVIAAADRPVLLCGLTSDKRRLRAAVRAARLRQTQTDMAAAVEMAVSVTGVARTLREMEKGGDISAAERPPADDEVYVGLTQNKTTEAAVVLLSDGAFPPLPKKLAEKMASADGDGASLGAGSRFLRFGQPESDNRAIVSLDLRGAEEGRRQLFARLENMRPERTEVTLDLYLDDAFLDRKTLSLPPRRAGKEIEGMAGAPGNTGAVFDLSDEARGVLKLRFAQADSFPVDDEMQAVLQPPEPIRALLVTDGNYFLERALSADAEAVRFDVLSPERYPADEAPRTADGRGYEIHIFDRWAPARVPPGGSLFVAVTPPLPGIAEADPDPLYAPMMLDWNRAHPLLREMTLLDRLAILRCRHWTLAEGWAALIESEALALQSAEELADADAIRDAPAQEAPLLVCRLDEDRRIAALAFDIFDTESWPLKLSFPIFIRNATHWLGRPGGDRDARAYATGETVRLTFDTETANAVVALPSGESISLAVNGRSAYLSRTEEPGLYRVRAPGETERLLAFNLLSANESDNAARSALRFGEEKLSAERGAARRNTELWPYVAVAALLMLLGEWYVYNRRILG